MVGDALVRPWFGEMPVTEATITCPECGADKREAMPENACRHLYTCASCGTILRPREGDCCVFCSYSDQLCPPRQAQRVS